MNKRAKFFIYKSVFIIIVSIVIGLAVDHITKNDYWTGFATGWSSVALGLIFDAAHA